MTGRLTIEEFTGEGHVPRDLAIVPTAINWDQLPFVQQLDAVLADVRTMLITKNQAYGNSALDPVRVFSRADTAEQIRVRIDDKISRLQRGHDAGEDTVRDLLGYLVLLLIAERA